MENTHNEFVVKETLRVLVISNRGYKTANDY